MTRAKCINLRIRQSCLYVASEKLGYYWFDMQNGSVSLPLHVGFDNRKYFDQCSVSRCVKAMRSSLCFHFLSCDYACARGEKVQVSLLFQKE